MGAVARAECVWRANRRTDLGWLWGDDVGGDGGGDGAFTLSKYERARWVDRGLAFKGDQSEAPCGIEVKLNIVLLAWSALDAGKRQRPGQMSAPVYTTGYLVVRRLSRVAAK